MRTTTTFVPVDKFLISGDLFRSDGNVERGKKVPEAFTTRKTQRYRTKYT